MKIKTLECPRCGDIVFSRYKHDYRRCSCGAIAVDGGLDYLKISFQPDLTSKPKVDIIKVNLTKEELQKDYESGEDKYGLIVAEYGPGFKGRKW